MTKMGKNQNINHCSEHYECDKGWEPLITEAKEIVSQYNIEHPDEDILDFVQIKEKFGGLCLYLNKYIPEVQAKINRLQNRSFHICEHCGTDKNVKTEWTHGWIMTLCDKCRKEEIERYNAKLT